MKTGLPDRTRRGDRPFPATVRMLFLVAVVFWLYALSGAASSSWATQATDDEDLKTVFDAAVEAAGGESAIAEIRSVRAFARCQGPTGPYTTEIHSFLNDKTRFVQIFPERPEPSDVVIHGDVAWQITGPDRQPSLIRPAHRLVIRLHEYQRMAIDFQSMFTDFSLVGDASFADKTCTRVDAVADPGSPIHLFFDKQSGLLAGYALPTAQGTVTNVFNQWQQVGQVQLPSVVTATDQTGDFVLRFEQITINESSEAALEIPPRVSDLAELTRLQQQATTAHLNRDANLLVDLFANDGISEIRRGEVTRLTREQGLQQFEQYFGRVQFLEWADTAPPAIELSADGTMATITVQKRVRTQSNENRQEDSSTEFAWLEVWRKFDDQWKLVTVASTDRPGQLSEAGNDPPAEPSSAEK